MRETYSYSEPPEVEAISAISSGSLRDLHRNKNGEVRPKFVILHTGLTAMYSYLKFRKTKKKSGEISDNFKKMLIFGSDG